MKNEIQYDIVRCTIRRSSPKNSGDIHKRMKESFENLKLLREDPDLSIQHVKFTISDVPYSPGTTDYTCQLSN